MRRAAKQWTQLCGRVLLVLVIAVLLEYLSVHYNHRYNLAGNLKYELSERTKKIIHSLNHKLTIIHFGPRNKPQTDLMRKMLDLYVECSHKVSYRIVDPERNPMLAKRYKVGPTERVTIVLYNGKKERVIVDSERDLTNAILRLSTGKIKVYFLKRDGEYDPFKVDTIYTRVLDLLEDENYVVKPLNWSGKKYIPKDADLIIVWRPKKQFSKEELEMLYSYFQRGGKLLFMLEPFTMSSLNLLFDKFHVEIKDDIVVDKASRLIGGDMFMPIISEDMYGKDVIVNTLTMPVMIPMVRPIYVKEAHPNGYKVEVFLKTSPYSWTVTKEMYDKWEFDYKKGMSKKGPLPIGVSICGDGNKKGRIVIVGSADFVTNPYIDTPGLDNADLFMNIVEWLCRGENLIAQRPAPKKFKYRPLREEERKMLLYLVIFLPLMVLCIGAILYLRLKRARI
jgi:ABC-type uncharacterized transport system involved in gliding motility auxiliary subunit